VIPRNKDLIKNVPAGTHYFQLAGGGGGYGDPARRDRDLLTEEIRNGIISAAQAQQAYHLDSSQTQSGAGDEL
jgi:N-methylhydantoinase B